MPTENGKPTADPTSWLNRYGDSFYAYAYSRLHDVGAAEEVVQETFLAGFKHLDSYRGDSQEKSWLITILRRKIVDFVRVRDRHLKRQAKEEELSSCPIASIRDGVLRVDPSDSTSAPHKAACFNELWDRLHECLDLLPQSQRDAFVLRELEHLSAEDICKKLSISSANLWVRLHRARLRLVDCLGQSWVALEHETEGEVEDHVG